MQKILIITLEFPPQVGGIATYVHQFACSLPSEQIVVLAPKCKGGKEFDAGLKFKVIRKNPYLPRFFWPRWLRLLWQVFWLAKKEKIDIIYLHHVLPVGYVGWLMKKIRRTPYIVFSHGTDIEAGLSSGWKRRMLKLATKEAEQIIFNSESLKRRLLRLLPELENRAAVLYPCPEEIFYESPTKEELAALRSQYALEGKKVMLSVGRLADGKGFPHLVRIMPEIVKQVPNLVWVIIGDGPKKDYLWGQIQKKSLQNIVRFLGEIPHNGLKNYYYLADLFVVLTHPDEGREEGLGLVFLEAAAAGIPVVAGQSGGVEEGVLNGQTGVVVDIYQGDKILIETIVKLLKDENYARQLGEKAQQRMKAEFRWEEQMRVIEKWK